MISNPLGLDILNATGYVTGQDTLDQAHADEIADSMRANGWQGAPLVILPDHAIAYSGTHRLAAADQVELDEVPAVDLRALFAACGLDLDDLCDDEGLSPLLDRPEIVRLLPADVAAAYCIDDII